MDNEEQVISAFKLWKSDLMTNEDFYETLVRIRGNTPLPSSAINPNSITQGQKNYISRLKMEGKIPQTQSLNITKQEAQILISNVVNPNKIAEGHQPLNRTEQTGSDYRETKDALFGYDTSKSPDTQDLYKEKEDY
jgi:hypothetical protein